MNNGVEKIYKILMSTLLPVSRVLNGIAGVCLFLLMLLITIDVILRYGFNHPILGSFDMAQYLMGVVVAGGVAYCAIKKGHTVVEILIERMTNTGRNIVNAITFFLSAVFVGIASWRLIDYTVSTYQSGLRSSVLPIPTFPFMAFVTLCFWIFSLVFLAISLEYIRNIEGKK